MSSLWSRPEISGKQAPQGAPDLAYLLGFRHLTAAPGVARAAMLGKPAHRLQTRWSWRKPSWRRITSPQRPPKPDGKKRVGFGASGVRSLTVPQLDTYAKSVDMAGHCRERSAFCQDAPTILRP